MLPEVVAEKSPIAWIELIANSRPMATQAEGSKLIEKCIETGDAVSAKEIAKRLGKAYDMPAEEVQEDVNAVLETFRNYGILERV